MRDDGIFLEWVRGEVPPSLTLVPLPKTDIWQRQKEQGKIAREA